MVLASSFYQLLHFNCEPGSKTSATKALQYLGVILLQVDHEFSIYFTNDECMPYESIISLNLIISNIAIGFQLALTESWGYLSFGNSYMLTVSIKVGCLKTLYCNVEIDFPLKFSVWI